MKNSDSGRVKSVVESSISCDQNKCRKGKSKGLFGQHSFGVRERRAYAKMIGGGQLLGYKACRRPFLTRGSSRDLVPLRALLNSLQKYAGHKLRVGPRYAH
jgi:hypothetical protein